MFKWSLGTTAGFSTARRKIIIGKEEKDWQGLRIGPELNIASPNDDGRAEFNFPKME